MLALACDDISMRLPLALTLFTCLCMALPGQSSDPQYYSVPQIDAPELAPIGQHAVGVRTMTLTNPGQPDVLKFDNETKKAPLTDRQLTVEVWYPAQLSAGQQAHTIYTDTLMSRSGPPKTYTFPGKALRDAPPATGGKYPVLVVSHGYPGSRLFLTWLTENLASKGYVVAAIDHTDSVYGAVRGFPSTLLNRAPDQLFVLDSISKMAADPAHFLHNLADSSRAAIAGYSMGGYGALTSAGAFYSSSSAPARMVPGGYLTPWTQPAPRPANLKAVVAIAPWGAQPPINSWDGSGLSAIKIPTLFLAGDHDDISGYDPGIRTAYLGAKRSDRCLLTYENARHNIGGNPAPQSIELPFAAREGFEEPVWRKDRIIAINLHFITAFLDLHLKGDASRESFLRVAPQRGADGKWPAVPGAAPGGAFSKGDGYWKGFQRRWALGLKMECMPPAEN